MVSKVLPKTISWNPQFSKANWPISTALERSNVPVRWLQLQKSPSGTVTKLSYWNDGIDVSENAYLTTKLTFVGITSSFVMPVHP